MMSGTHSHSLCSFGMYAYTMTTDNQGATSIELGRVVFQDKVSQDRNQNLAYYLGADLEIALSSALSNNGKPYVTYREYKPFLFKVSISQSFFRGEPVLQLQVMDVTDLQNEQEKRGQIFARVCHDLRTPLQGIVGLSENEALERKSESGREIMETIKHEGQRLAFIIQDILDASKLKQKKFNLTMVPINLFEKVEKVVNSIKGALITEEVVLSNRVDKDLYVSSDSIRVEQILYNLVGNACKFTNTGEITVSAKSVEGSNGDGENQKFIQVYIQDTGIGIKQEHIHKLFDEFYQVPVEPSTSTPPNDPQSDECDDEPRGTGLGLAICKALVELHGGQISVTSTFGSGSCFQFTLQQEYKLQQESTDRFSVFDDDYVNTYKMDDVHQVPDEKFVELFGKEWGTGSFRYGTGGQNMYSKIRKLILDHSNNAEDQKPQDETEGMSGDELLVYFAQRFPEWYVGAMSRGDAANELLDQDIGTFLVRTGRFGPTISVRYVRIEDGVEKDRMFNVQVNQVQEYRADGKQVTKCYISENQKYSDLGALVLYYMAYPSSFFNNLAEGRPYKYESLIPLRRHLGQ